MADVNLSKAVRSNLLSLQSTAAQMAKTQNRLATGLKVNSALDNPTNFFTASSLNSRAGDMANLLDAMSNGIKTIEAADNGLSSITKTVESMQSTLRQARQDKSFKAQSMDLDLTAIAAGGTVKNLTFGGGALASSVTVDLNTLAGSSTATTFTGGAGTFSTNFASGSFTIDGTTVAITGDVASQTASLTGSGGAAVAASGESGDIEITVEGVNGGNPFTVSVADSDTLANVATAINSAWTTAGGTGTLADATSGQIVLTNTAGGNISVADAASNSNGTSGIIGFGSGNAASTNGTLGVDATLATVQAEIDTALGSGYTVGNDGTGITISKADGTDLVIAGDATLRAAIGFSGTGSTNGTAGAAAATKTVDQLVTEINGNTSLNTAVRASNDNGKLRIENLSTTNLTVGGYNTTSAKVDGTGSTTIGGNEVRANLIKQFNELRDQLDKFADDASFNGINLLRGDKLKLTFNESGSSTIDIQAKVGTSNSINSSTLSITSALNSDFDNDSSIDSKLDTLATALGTLRSQASAFGSNLSVVENRTDFTKRMINTLETGAANLTLADTNEEAANLLALQTRQQLSSTALSMASQSDQAVLRLF